MILDFELERANISFEKQILPLTRNIYSHFNYFLSDFEAVIIIEQNPLFFIFLNYVPFGYNTALTTYEDSISNIPPKPRSSKGEWVVEIVFKCQHSDAEHILNKLSSKDFKENNIIEFIKNELANF